jgi:hypothetical protein
VAKEVLLWEGVVVGGQWLEWSAAGRGGGQGAGKSTAQQAADNNQVLVVEAARGCCQRQGSIGCCHFLARTGLL